MPNLTPSLPLSGGQMNTVDVQMLRAEPLWARLSTLTEDTAATIRWVLASPKRTQEVMDMLPGLERAQKAVGTDPEGCALIYRAMEPMRILYGEPNMDEGDLRVWWSTYYKALGALPLAAIEHAVSEHIRTSEMHVIPNPGRLVKLAESLSLELRRTAWRAKEAAKAAAKRAPAKDEETDEQKAARRADTARLLADMRSRPNPLYSAPPVRRPDAGGLSEDAKALVRAGLHR